MSKIQEIQLKWVLPHWILDIVACPLNYQRLSSNSKIISNNYNIIIQWLFVLQYN